MPLYFLTQAIEQGGTPAVEKRLIEAKNESKAIRYVTDKSIACRIATPVDIVECTKAGLEIEKVAP